jgi:hypothetical protein
LSTGACGDVGRSDEGTGGVMSLVFLVLADTGGSSSSDLDGAGFLGGLFDLVVGGVGLLPLL